MLLDCSDQYWAVTLRKKLYRIRSFQKLRFSKKVAIITAAASGIGRAALEIIAQEGGTVIAVDTDDGRLEQMSGELTEKGCRIFTYCIDGLKGELVSKTVSEISKNNGQIDILINAIGGSTIITNPSARVEDLSLDDWQSIINFNLNSMFLFTNSVVPIMKSQGSGKMVNLASIAG